MRARPLLRGAALWLAALFLMPAAPAPAQDSLPAQSPVLVVDSNLLYLDSAFGRRVLDEIEAENSALAAENRQIEAELRAEESDLTVRRPQLEPAEFRELANEFDEKVRRIRREQEAKARSISRRQEDARGEFLTAAAPVLEDIMREAGAAVVLERRTVFLSVNAIDITDVALQRINAEIGTGAAAGGSGSD